MVVRRPRPGCDNPEVIDDPPILFLAFNLTASAAPTIDSCADGSGLFPFAHKCDIDGVNGCVWDPMNQEVVCDLETLSCAASDAWVYAVSTGSDEISAFGTCSVGGYTRSFCCEIDDVSSEIRNLSLWGTAGEEEPIAFHYGTYDLAPTSYGSLLARAYGRGGADIVNGSRSTDSDYIERLYGDAGIDDIDGFAGNDELYGGTGGDYMYGGEGDDKLFGGDGVDRLWGDEGDDWLHGGYHDDYLYGGDEDDVLFGGRGNDELDGEIGSDTLCETTWPQYGVCPTTQDLTCGGSGIDRAGMYEHASCPASGSTLTGSNDCDEMMDQDFDWSDVWETSSAPIVQPTPPYQECVDIAAMGGN